MNASNEIKYEIPARYRKMENMHIIFWLLKDISWCMGWKPLGVAMVVPTLTIAVMITWRTREIKSELAHNLAVTFWICANAYWMISEFFHFDSMRVWRGFEGRHLTIIPFFIGSTVLAYYYLIQKRKEGKETSVATL
jgi:prepilin signal peptidase PulO-like enzyme (type II secretory pathway)